MTKISSVEVPQANSLSKVCDLLALLDAGLSDRSELENNLGLVEREINYYKSAARILGFIAPEGHILPAGTALLSCKEPAETSRLLRQAVMETRVVRELMNFCGNETPDRKNVTGFLREHTVGLKPTTVARRANTILAWIKEAGIGETGD